MRALGFDVKKAEVVKLMHEYDRQETGQISYQDFVDISMMIVVYVLRATTNKVYLGMMVRFLTIVF